jgi:hypothetical protein
MEEESLSLEDSQQVTRAMIYKGKATVADDSYYFLL